MYQSYLLEKGAFEKPRCIQSCPAGINVPLYIRLAKEGKYSEAISVIRENAPFPGVLAYVCPAFCELRCRRSEIDEPVAINAIKRFLMDKGSNLEEPPASAQPSGKSVAVIGSGPAGLTAAYFLAKSFGHRVTVFEAMPVVGGMMRLGIPDYRLPKDLLDGEIKLIKKLGVKIKTNAVVKSLNLLLERGFDAIFIAIGAWNSSKLHIDGEDQRGVLDGISFLKEINLGRRMNLGKRVAVIGGGNVAIDAARVAFRLGVKEVNVFYRRTREEMPTRANEVDQALEKRIHFTFLASPKKITKKRGALHVEFTRMSLGKKDASGRRESEPIPGNEFTIGFDNVIVAVGERADIPSGFSLTTDMGNNICVDPVTLATSKKAIYAGGDCVTGPSSVIEAIAAGKKAAIYIDKFLGGRGIIEESFLNRDEDGGEPWDESILDIPRQRMPLLNVEMRKKCFDVVELGFSSDMAQKEVQRCLLCDLKLGVKVDLSKCVECYSCQTVCSLVYHQACNPEKAHIIVDLKKGTRFFHRVRWWLQELH